MNYPDRKIAFSSRSFWVPLVWLLITLCVVPVQAELLRPVVGRDRVHTVSAGENMYSIAHSYGMAIEHLAFANRLSVQLEVAPGTRLLIPGRRVLPAAPPENGIVVNLPERGFFLFRDGQFEKFYPIAIGSPGRFMTPPGSYQLVSRVVNPNWLPPDWAGMGKDTIVPAGPENPLGDRWMGLSTSGLGFHSTTSPTYIGAAVSHGCMRMYPDSAREVFEKVEVGWPVRIEYETVKLGLDETTGEVFLSVFPDVYWMMDVTHTTREKLRQLGALELVGEEKLLQLTTNPRGSPQLLIGAGEITVDGQPLQTDSPALLSRGSLLVPSSVVRALGMKLSYDAASRSVTVSRDGVERVFSVREDPATASEQIGPILPLEGEVSRAYLWRGQTLLPARPLLSQFGILFRWEQDTRTLHIGG